MIALLVVMTKSYLFRHCDKGPSPVPDVTEAKISVLLAIAVQKGRCVQSKLTNYYATVEQFYKPFVVSQ